MIQVTIIFAVASMLWWLFIKCVFRFIYKMHKSVAVKFGRSVLLITGFVVICYTYLSQFDISKEVSKTLLQSGSFLLAIATFSCQQVLGNVVSGFMLSSSRPFDIGDKIALYSTGGVVIVEGIVIGMNVRHVIIKKPDGRHDFITNSIVDSCIIENSNVLDDNGRLFTMECTYDSDVRLAMKLMEEEINKCPLVINKDLPAANILCSNLGANGYELKTTIWAENISDSFIACSELRINITRVWHEHGIELPYNTVTVIKG